MVKVPYETDTDRFKYNEYIDFYSKVHARNKNKKKYIDSYRKKNDWCVNKKQRKYIDSYNRKEKNDWCVHCKSKKQRKYINSYNMEGKNDWCVCCKQKKKKQKMYIDSYVHVVNKKSKESK